ncbi:hypothetical protein [uncultured Sunxiuqinia sp.]|uniref:hypothetical protein n=1 Tax=uncultured Sunxiuqinia sp. TaxID=1573825 RepID=UPI00262B9BD9|nr:hypothetical protein [uncultured Sunxiuqinia sp.]
MRFRLKPSTNYVEAIGLPAFIYSHAGGIYGGITIYEVATFEQTESKGMIALNYT